MKPHKHAEVIKAWADGLDIQIFVYGEWVDNPNPAFDKERAYRIKPAAPKWPQTTMSEDELDKIYVNADGDRAYSTLVVANAAIAHACESGQVVPNETVDKLMLQCHHREKELRDQIFKLTFPLIPSGVNVKFSMPTPKPKVYMTSFNHGEIVGRDMQMAINVRAACYAKLPGQVSNEELKTLINLAK